MTGLLCHDTQPHGISRLCLKKIGWEGKHYNDHEEVIIALTTAYRSTELQALNPELLVDNGSEIDFPVAFKTSFINCFEKFLH